MKIRHMKWKRLHQKHKTEKKESLDEVTEEFKQEVSANKQWLSAYRKTQNQYYQNKMFRTDGKKFYDHRKQKDTVKKHNNQERNKERLERNGWRKESGMMKQPTWSKQHRNEGSPISGRKVNIFTINKDEMESACTVPNKNVWLEQRTVMYKYLATIFDKLIEEIKYWSG